MKQSKETVRIAVKVVSFLMILFLLFQFFTYYLRDTDRVSRQSILEFYDEPENTLDVVFIGASGIYRYWDPMLAWQEYGLASRNFSTSEMHIATYLTAIKEILETQSPELIVLETRQFTKNFDNTTVVAGIRRVIDSMDIGLDRLAAAKYACDVMDIPINEAISLYVDLIQYHDNYDAFGEDINWELADNRLDTVLERNNCYKGHCITAKHVPFDDPSQFLTDARKELHPKAEQIYRDILDYCVEHNVKLMMLSTPYVVSEDRVARTNTLQDIAESYGVPFVNTNYAYEDMGLSFAEDFYDGYHVNVLGSRKFTRYFAEYMVENHSLPDHRDDEAYASWHILSEEYNADVSQQLETVQALHERRNAAALLGEKLKQTEDPFQWITAATGSDVSLVIMSNEKIEHSPAEENRLALRSLGITDKLLDGDGRFAVIYNGKVVKTMTGKTSGKMGSGKLAYTVSFGEDPSLQLQEEECYFVTAGGIQLVAVNNFTDEVMDSVVLSVTENGELELAHIASSQK